MLKMDMHDGCKCSFYTLYNINNNRKHSVWWEKSRGWMCCAAEHLTIMNRAETPPGVLECDELACWIILTGIKILFVIETQTSAESLNSGKR